MAPPSIWMRTRHLVGRALRETGQALDRLGIKTQSVYLAEDLVGDDAPCKYDDFLSRHRHQFPLIQSGRPIVSPDVAYLAPCSTLVGSVRIGAGSSVWYKAVIRADECHNGSSFESENEEEVWELNKNRLTAYKSSGELIGGGVFIGENTNVQDGCVITSRKDHTIIGDGVTIGHMAQIHSAKIDSFCLIGMGCVISEGCEVQEESFIAAGAVLPPNTFVPSGELWAGNPARKLRDLTIEQREKLHYQSAEYVKVATGQKGVMELGGNLPDGKEKLKLIGLDVETLVKIEAKAEAAAAELTSAKEGKNPALLEEKSPKASSSERTSTSRSSTSDETTNGNRRRKLQAFDKKE